MSFWSRFSKTDSMASLAQHGRTFYWASFLLGPKAAREAGELYYCCRQLDDIADEGTAAINERLDMLDTVKDAVESDDQDNHNALALRCLEVAKRSPECQQALIHLIQGMQQDLGRVALLTEAELDQYCYRVAGTVGLLMCPILGTQDRNAFAFAVDLGIGMQLTNICRDVLEDARMGRRYLPCDIDVKAIGESRSDARERIQQVIADQIRRADAYYESGFAGLRYLPRASRCAIYLAARWYQAIGHKIKKSGVKWWQGRVVVSGFQKLWILLKSLPCLITLLVLPRHKPSIRHNERLHAHLDAFHHGH